jgi:hypothetical protein
MIDDLHREADALPTLRTGSWVVLGSLFLGALLDAGIYWIVKCVVDVVIAIGWPV